MLILYSFKLRLYRFFPSSNFAFNNIKLVQTSLMCTNFISFRNLFAIELIKD